MPLVKTNYVSQPTSFGRGCSQGLSRICDLQVLKDIWRHFTADVSHFRPYTETKNNGCERKVCMKWIQFRSWLRPSGAKVSLSRNSPCFCLYTFVRMFLSCSMIMTFPSLLKSWSCLLKCLQAGIALGILTSFLWLLSLMLKGVPDLPRMYPSIETHLAVVRGLPTRKFQTECVNEKSSTERRS